MQHDINPAEILSWNYKTILYCDVNTRVITPYKISKGITQKISISANKNNIYYVDDFFVFFTNNYVCDEYRNKFIETFNLDNIKKVCTTNVFIEYDYKIHYEDGERFYRTKIVKDFENECSVIIGVADIDQERAYEINQFLYTDLTTGGNNYTKFKISMKNNKLSGFYVSMDIRSFKIINATCGIEKGDETLREIYWYLSKNLNTTEYIARISADHFVFFLDSISGNSVRRKLKKLSNGMIDISNKLDIPLLVPYFGVSKWDNSKAIEVINGEANAAKQEIRSRIGNRVSFYSKKNIKKLVIRKQLESDFERALADKDFKIFYQPKFTPDGKVMTGAEALVRWIKADGTTVMPSLFIPIFEENNYIKRLDEYIFTEVCTHQKEWMEMGIDTIPISINISRVSLYYPGIVTKYKNIIGNNNLDISKIQIEITESAMIEDITVKETIEEFHNQGFTLHMDDFGSGYSSLATLNCLPFDVIKIDKSLVDFIGDDKTNGNKTLLHTISLAKDLGMVVTVEGVENIDQLNFLTKAECDNIQGFYFSKPLRHDAFTQRLCEETFSAK